MVLMRRPKWLSGWGKGKNTVEVSLIIDTPDIRVVEASQNEKLFLVAIGTSPSREIAISGEKQAVAVGDKNETELKWKIFYDSIALPDFMSFDKAKDFMAGTVAVCSGARSVYDADTVYVASGKRPSKGNAPLLLDYETAKKIEEARKKRTI